MTFVPAVSPLVRIEGRTAPGPGGRLRMGFPGVTLHLRSRGGELSMAVDARTGLNFFDVAVDGAPASRLEAAPGAGTYPLLAGGDPATVHEVAVTFRAGGWQGTADVTGFETGERTQLLSPGAPKPWRLLFIGDSVTGGEMAEARDDDPLNARFPGGEHAANAARSFGFVLSRRLGAECHLVSYGGRGIIRDWQGLTDVANAPQFYGRSLPDDPAAPWDQASYVPDAIGIGLGTNDFNLGVPDESTFVDTYAAFLRKVRLDAPKAPIFLIESPILEDAPGQPPKRTMLRVYLEQIVRRAADPLVAIAPIRKYAGVPNDGHPLASEHLMMADELEPRFRRALGL